ncbi:YadA C-terminal domain-containing protein [Actinobacillus delphinicola]|uniref:YadA C-terminal domain-containing protein n=1 Tax=Actinobacillus delphinicola TaxID=51161 RepID=UPI002442E08B|nr:YadA C-terminal domain-containing protein [Actinobacillus delphinicola]
MEVLGDGSNIQTHIEKTKDEKTKININLSDHIHVKQITIQDTPEQGSTTINDHGVTVKSADGKQVSVTDKGLDNGGNVISNVAEGKATTDAVNVKQLNVLSNEINTLKNSMGGDIGKALRDMRHQIKQNRKESNAGSASAIAAANLPQPFSAGRSIVGAAIGSYRNQQAISIGASRISDNGKWIIRSSITQDTQHNFGAGMGFGYQW